MRDLLQSAGRTCTMASAGSMRSRTPGLRAAEEYYRACTGARPRPGICVIGTCSPPCKTLLADGGPDSKAVVWAHNSHVGNAAATEMALGASSTSATCVARNSANSAYLVGFGTNSGTVAAASDWDGPMEIKKVRPALPRAMSDCAMLAGTALSCWACESGRSVRANSLGKPQLERAIGVVYRPETERASHYFRANLPRQFDEYVWFDDTRGDPAGRRRDQGTSRHISVRGVSWERGFHRLGAVSRKLNRSTE